MRSKKPSQTAKIVVLIWRSNHFYRKAEELDKNVANPFVKLTKTAGFLAYKNHGASDGEPFNHPEKIV